MCDVVPTTMKRAWVRVMSLDAARALRTLQSLQSRSNDSDGSAAHEAFEVLDAAISAASDDRRALHEFALSAPINGGARRSSAVASVLCRLAHWQRGDLERFHASRRPSSDGDDPSVTALDRALDAAVELQQLRLAVATKLARESIELAGRARRRCPTHRFGEVLLAQMLYEQGELEQAEALLRDHFQAMRTGACADVAIGLYTVLARIAIDQSKGDLAMLLLRDGIAIGEARGWQRLIAACSQELIELFICTGRIAQARECLRALQERCSDTASHDAGLAGALVHMQCRVHVAGGEAAEAIPELARLQLLAKERGDIYACARVQIRLAEALDACGRTADALDTLADTLELGCRAGLHQSFVSAGPAVNDLLLRFVRTSSSEPHRYGSLQPYASSLLRHGRLGDPPSCARAIKLRGPLSGREHAILRLMRHGSSNKLIARQLGIAPETVKSHAKRIFVKLGAQTRVEAVTKAANLSLI